MRDTLIQMRLNKWLKNWCVDPFITEIEHIFRIFLLKIIKPHYLDKAENQQLFTVDKNILFIKMKHSSLN